MHARFVYSLFCCYCCLQGGLLAAKPIVAGSFQVADQVRLLVNTDGFLRKPTTDGNFQVLGASVEVFCVPPGAAIMSDELYAYGPSLPLSKWPAILYRCITPGDTTGWRPILQLPAPAAIIPLTRCSLMPGQECLLEFRFNKSQEAFQSTLIQRPLLLPVFVGLNQHDSSLTSLTHAAGRLPANGIKTRGLLPGNRLSLLPGKPADLYFLQPGWNTDSCLEYRFRAMSDSNTASWTPSDTLVHFGALPGNTSYLLEVRYAGGGTPVYFYMDTVPYWYQRRQVQLATGLITLALLPCFMWLNYRYRLRRASQHRRRLEEQFQLIRNQLNPHFIYNSLSSIQGLISTGRNESANEYLSVFSTMMRHTMSVADKPVVTLAEDLGQVEQYLRIEQLRFEFSYQIQVDPAIDLDTIEMPPQFLQPTVENAVRHGVAGMGASGHILVSIQQAHKNLCITIVNNASLQKSVHQGYGYGIRFTSEQVNRLRQLYAGRQITYNVDIGKSGATVRFFFENWLNPET